MAQGQQVALQVAVVVVVVETWVVVLVIVMMMIIPCMRMSGLLHLNLWLVTN